MLRLLFIGHNVIEKGTHCICFTMCGSTQMERLIDLVGGLDLLQMLIQKD